LSAIYSLFPYTTLFRSLQMQINDQCAAIMALGAHRAQEKSRIDELNELLALARTEIVARDDTVARLRNSPSWKVTAPLRFMMRKDRKSTRLNSSHQIIS